MEGHNQLSEARRVLEQNSTGPFDDLQVLGIGGWSSAFSFRQGGVEYVLRLSAHEKDFIKDRLAMRFASARLPIPEVALIGQTRSGYFAISKRAHGRTVQMMSEAEMRMALPSLFSCLDELRTADVSESAGYGPWKRDGSGSSPTWREFLLDEFVATHLEGWQPRLAQTETAQHAYDRGYALLRERVDVCPELRCVTHGDIHNNTLFDGPKVTAMFDWGCGRYGDFLYDIAWLTIWQPMFKATRNIDLRGEALSHYAATEVPVPNFEERLLCYEVAIGLDSLRYSAFVGTDDISIVTNRLNEIVDRGFNATTGLC